MKKVLGVMALVLGVTLVVWAQEKLDTSVRTLWGHSDAIWSVAFAPNGNTLAIGRSISRALLTLPVSSGVWLRYGAGKQGNCNGCLRDTSFGSLL